VVDVGGDGRARGHSNGIAGTNFCWVFIENKWPSPFFAFCRKRRKQTSSLTKKAAFQNSGARIVPRGAVKKK
jgi:hypothetical protein